MGMTRAQKEAEVQALHGQFTQDEMVVVTHYAGLTVSDLSALRKSLGEQGASFKVTKNSLAKIALKDTKFEAIADMFTGPTGIASSQDPVAAAKAVYEFRKENDKLVILGGALGSEVLDVAAVESLAKLPSLDEIRSKLVGVLQAPLSKLVGTLQAPAREMVGVTKAFADKGE